MNYKQFPQQANAGGNGMGEGKCDVYVREYYVEDSVARKTYPLLDY